MSTRTDNITTAIEQLASAGGSLGALGEAALICQRKSEDYNGGSVSRDAYYPFGLKSYAQMIHTKSLRLVSLCQQGSDKPNFESARDTCIDLINYASFCADWLERNEKESK